MFSPLQIVCLSLCGLTALMAPAVAAPDLAPAEAPADKAIQPYQTQLIDLAFESATVIPTDPHIKDRSRAQQSIVEACFELDQPRRALGYIERIDNWRRGAGYADYADYCAKHGAEESARKHLDLAEGIARADNLADWRRGEILIRIANAYTRLGDSEQAVRFGRGLEAHQRGRIEPAVANESDPDDLDQQFKEADRLAALGDFDVSRNLLAVYAKLYDHFYADAERRALIERKIHQAWEKLPVFVRIDTLLALATSAREHDDDPAALRLVDQAQAMADGAEWPAEYGVPLSGRLARHRALAGDTSRARAQADAALALFHKTSVSIFDIDRAEAMVPIAEAYAAMGDRDTALATYRLAMDQAVINPNSRPRAEDLTMICRSMALGAVEPDAALWARMRQIHQGLGRPW